MAFRREKVESQLEFLQGELSLDDPAVGKKSGLNRMRGLHSLHFDALDLVKCPAAMAELEKEA